MASSILGCDKPTTHLLSKTKYYYNNTKYSTISSLFIAIQTLVTYLAGLWRWRCGVPPIMNGTGDDLALTQTTVPTTPPHTHACTKIHMHSRTITPRCCGRVITLIRGRQTGRHALDEVRNYYSAEGAVGRLGQSDGAELVSACTWGRGQAGRQAGRQAGEKPRGGQN